MRNIVGIRKFKKMVFGLKGSASSRLTLSNRDSRIGFDLKKRTKKIFKCLFLENHIVKLTKKLKIRFYEIERTS